MVSRGEKDLQRSPSLAWGCGGQAGQAKTQTQYKYQ